MDEHVEFIAKLRKIRMDRGSRIFALADEELNRCPFWVPNDPGVPFNKRQQCLRLLNHPGEHTSVYVIDELGLD